MTTQFVLVTIIAALISGLIGVLISARFFSRLEKRKLKIDTARRLLGYRYDVTSEQFSVAINEVFVVFGDSSKVLKAMQDFYEALSAPGKPHADERLVTFLKTICEDVGIVHKDISDAYFRKTFNLRN